MECPSASYTACFSLLPHQREGALQSLSSSTEETRIQLPAGAARCLILSKCLWFCDFLFDVMFSNASPCLPSAWPALSSTALRKRRKGRDVTPWDGSRLLLWDILVNVLHFLPSFSDQGLCLILTILWWFSFLSQRCRSGAQAWSRACDLWTAFQTAPMSFGSQKSADKRTENVKPC